MPRINKYDIKSIKRLYSEYHVTQRELANFIGITRQAMHIALQKESFPYWQEKELSDLEKQTIFNMIDELETEYWDVSLHVKIYNDMESCALLIKNDKVVKCIFNIPEDINEALFKAGFHKYREHDFQAIELLSEYADENKVVKITDPDVRLTLNNLLDKSFHNSLKEFYRFLGFKFKHPNSLTDQEICAKIEKFHCPETNTVYIGSDRNEYFWFSRRAFQEGKTIEEWMAFYGYKYDSRGKENTEQRFISFIENNLLIKDNLVYIDYIEHDYIYSYLNSLAYTRNMTINELLQKWGLKKISKKEYAAIKQNNHVNI